VEGSFARRFDFLSGARDIADFFRLPTMNRAPVKSHSFKLKIVKGILRYR
jgi:hypothetical protein